MSLEAMPLENPKQKTLRLPKKVEITPSEHESRVALGRETFNVFGEQANDIYTFYEEIIKWLKIPYIEDDYMDHEDRRKWYKYLDEKESAKMQNSKYRNNRMTPLFIIYQILQLLLKKSGVTEIPGDLFPSHLQEMHKLGSTALPKEERKEIIQKWEKQFARIADFIESCAKKQKMAA